MQTDFSWMENLNQIIAIGQSLRHPFLSSSQLLCLGIPFSTGDPPPRSLSRLQNGDKMLCVELLGWTENNCSFIVVLPLDIIYECVYIYMI